MAKKNNKEVNLEDEYLDPKIDFVFKRIFGHDEANFIDFANKVLNLEENKQIKSVKFLNLEIQKDQENDKESRLDVLAVLNDGLKINIEMQVGDPKLYEKRSLYYWAKTYEEQIKNAMKYDLCPVISIHVLNFNIYNDIEGFHTKLTIVDDTHQRRRCSDFELHYLELPKIQKTCYDQTDPLEKWGLFLKNPTKENLEHLAMQDNSIAKAVKDLEILSHDPKSRAIYEARKKAIMDFNNAVSVAGIEAKIEVARNLKAMSLSIKDIMKATGLSKEQVEKA